MNELVMFSHVRWNFVRKRPQQIASRLARHLRVLFVEEPVYCAGAPRAELSAPCHGVTVLTPHTPLTAPGFHDDQIPLLAKVLGHAIWRERFIDYGAWLSTPMALPLLTKLSPRVVVYDCMDEPAGMPRRFVQRENALMRVANVVFARGPSLREARRARRDDVHLVPSSVDREHFARGGDIASTHVEVKALARPRLGFFGVLDERLDIDLLREVALARPEWEICIVGPVVKIDPLTLPRAPNIHYYGRREYDELPAFLAGWDVAILPYARNEATRFIAPAQTLEYMAAGRAIVSTPVGDVKRLHGDVVRFADTAGAFVAQCEAALVEAASQRRERLAAMQGIVASTSWDETVSGMRRIVDAAARHGLTDAARSMLEPAKPSRPSVAAPTAGGVVECLIIGAGPTGLSTAYHYGAGSVVLEREARLGGGCRSIEDTGFTFDRAGHVMRSDDPHVQELYRVLLGDNVHWQVPEAWVYRSGSYARCAMRGEPHSLPSDVPCDCGENAFEAECSGADARFGYPLRGGFQALMNGFPPLLRGDLVLQADVARVSPLLRVVTLSDGQRLHYDTLVSTMPLPRLVAAMGDEAPSEIRRIAGELRHVSLRCVHLGVARPRVSDRHWIHFPEGMVFHRIFLQGNASPYCNPPGGFGLTCEIGHSKAKPLPCVGLALVERCFRDCVRAGLLDPSDVLLTSSEVDTPYAYVVDHPGRAERVAQIREWLANFDIVLAGRYGNWQEANAEHAFIAGRNAAQAARRLTDTRIAAKSA